MDPTFMAQLRVNARNAARPRLRRLERAQGPMTNAVLSAVNPLVSQARSVSRQGKDRMNTHSIHGLRMALALGLMLCTASASAIQAGKTSQGMSYISGGVSHSELAALHEGRDRYSLWVVTAASKSGAHLADVSVTIRDDRKRVVFEGRLDGPWLFIDLPLGRYQLEATLDGTTQKRATAIHRGDHHQAFFYFDTGDEVNPESHLPLVENTYGQTKK
jgi:hypothetical protein